MESPITNPIIDMFDENFNIKPIDLTNDEQYNGIKKSLGALKDTIFTTFFGTDWIDEFLAVIDEMRNEQIEKKKAKDLQEKHLDELIDEFLATEYKGVTVDNKVLMNAAKVLRAFAYFIINRKD